jgi:hypothetical protein
VADRSPAKHPGLQQTKKDLGQAFDIPPFFSR